MHVPSSSESFVVLVFIMVMTVGGGAAVGLLVGADEWDVWWVVSTTTTACAMYKGTTAAPWPTVISGIKHSIMILYTTTSLILENALSTSLRNLCDLDSCPCISLKVDHHNECFLNVTPVTDLLNLDRFEAHWHSDKSYTNALFIVASSSD